MDEIANLAPGDELDNERLCQIFGCGPQGGMRRSLQTNTLVLVCNHVKSIYDDRWIDGVLHYTGMGQSGDQSLQFMQNKTLAQSGSNGASIHLFEVHRPKVYTYVGAVSLAADPYEETQTDEGGHSRKVWVFPLAPKSGVIPAVPVDVINELDGRKARKARRLSDEEIATKARQSGRVTVGAQPVIIKQHQRSVWVAEHAKRRAQGKCELCKKNAPFCDSSGRPYLETHHIKWLARGGADTVENTAALCPNCHRRMHVLDDTDDVKQLSLLIAG